MSPKWVDDIDFHYYTILFSFKYIMLPGMFNSLSPGMCNLSIQMMCVYSCCLYKNPWSPDGSKE